MLPSKRNAIRIPFNEAFSMILGYVKLKVWEQIRSVAFIICYLTIFQVVVLGSPPANALTLAVGVALVVAGLALFLEGVLRGLMPLGERVGITLPARCGIAIIVVFGVFVGLGATLAEPAISVLRTAGANVTAWDAPLLFVVLESYTEQLVISIALGVGAAVAIGVTRFYYGFSIKPIIYVVIPMLVGGTVLFQFDANLSTIIGLAWDSGAVTTGPVTVPLVLAVGIGVSRATGKAGAGNGFGVIMLASAFPVLAVFTLGLVLNQSVPGPTTEEHFFSAENRSAAMQIFGTEEDLYRHAVRTDSAIGRRALSHHAGDGIQEARTEHDSDDGHVGIASVIREESLPAARAVIPLTLLLLFVLLVLLRERPQYYDEVIFGIVLSLVGMILLTSGIRLGLAPLGDSVGQELPRAFRTAEDDTDTILIERFDPAIVLESIDTEGIRRQFFYLAGASGPELVEYHPHQFDPVRRQYRHILRRTPLFGTDLTLLGLGLVFLFAFGMGYGSTLAEPALNALGRTVEELTVGTVPRTGVVRAVSIGVGIGLMTGVARILYSIPLVWLIAPAYLVLVLLTIWSEEDFASIAWDCGGVTTGPVTVPLVLAMGLAIGSEMNMADGFGVLAMASVMPNIVVLLYGYIVRARQRRTIRDTHGGAGNE